METAGGGRRAPGVRNEALQAEGAGTDLSCFFTEEKERAIHYLSATFTGLLASKQFTGYVDFVQTLATCVLLVGRN